MTSKSVCGVGTYERGKFVAKIKGKATKEYYTWKGMLYRCYSKQFLDKNNTYIGCTASENFKNFQYFAEWCQSQVGFGKEGYHLDKDIVFKGNKLYSEDTCFFVPNSLNCFLVKNNSNRGKYPIGVGFKKDNNKFAVQCNDGSGNIKHLGLYISKLEAFQAYKIYKEALAKELALRYKEMVHPKVVEALNNYIVEIQD